MSEAINRANAGDSVNGTVELALLENQRMLSNLLENLSGMAYRCRNDEFWTMQFVSAGCRRLTGYAAEDLLNNRNISFEQIIHPEDREQVRRGVEIAMGKGLRFELTYRIVTAEGETRWVLEHGLAIRSQGREVDFIEGIITDINTGKCAELKLAEKERTLSAILDHSFQFIGLVDLEGRVLRANQAALEAGGARREDVEGRLFWETPWWSHSPAEQAKLRDAVRRSAQGEFVRFATTHPGPDGRLIHVDFSLKPVRDEAGRVVMMIPEGRDITQYREAVEALRESEEKFAKAFRASPYSLTISDLETGKLIEANAGFEALSGYRREEAIGRSTIDLGLWQNSGDRAALVQRLTEAGAVRGMEIDFRTKTGGSVTAQCNCELIELGGRPCMLNILEDVTDRRRAEKERALLEAQLRQNQKLEALGTLAGGIAHDFNNILTAIMVNQELAVMDIGRPEEAKRRLADIGKASNRAKELVRQILTFSRQQPCKRLRQPLQPLIKEALGLVRASLPASIEMPVELSGPVLHANVDATQVHQIVMNLCTNAAHAMKGGSGRLTVKLTSEYLDLDVHRFYPGLRPGNYARLTVEDTGHGMDAEVQARIFEPFFTTKGPGEGTGLGLAVVHGIMKDYEGGIYVKSRPGEGCAFTLFFPEMSGVPQGTKDAAKEIAPGNGERVLLVDDETAICEGLAAMLRRIGYRVECFTNPLLALELFRQNPSDFNLVISDLTMPQLTGTAFIAQVQRQRPGMPALLLSGMNPQARMRPRGFPAVYEELAKPPDILMLSLAVRRALAPRTSSPDGTDDS